MDGPISSELGDGRDMKAEIEASVTLATTELFKPKRGLELGIADRESPFSDPRIDKVHRHYQETYSLSDENTPEGKKLVEIARKLEDQEHQGKIKYRIINHPQINAFALGDTVYVFSGLLSRLQTTSEVASVLAHEITHIEKEDTNIHDSSNDPDSVHEVVSRLSLPRIHEYTSDAMVAEKLNGAGYNPTAYQRVLDMFHNLPKNGVDFAHGFSKDRQSAQILQMRLKDYEATSKEDNGQKPTELTEGYLAPRYQEQLFDRLYHLAETTHSNETLVAEIQKLSPHAILDFHSYLSGRITRQFAWDRRSQSPNSKEIYNASDLMTLTDQEVDRRISEAFPQMFPKEANWLRIILYTEVMDRKFGELQEPSDDIHRVTRGGFSNIDYAAQLMSTLRSENDVLAFAHLVKDHQVVQQLGYEPSSEFPRRIFSLFPDTWSSTSEDKFFLQTLRRLHPDPTGYSTSFDFVERVGNTLGSEQGSQGADWTVRILDKVKNDAQRHFVAQIKTMNPRLYDQDTPQAIIQYAPQIKPALIKLNQEYFNRAERYWGEHAEQHKEWELSMMAGALYSNLPYAMQEEYERNFIVEYQRAENPQLEQLLQLADAKNVQGIISFIKTNGAEAFNKYSRSARIAERDTDFSYQLLREVQKTLKGEYLPSAEDKAFVLELVRGSKIQTPELQKILGKYKDFDAKSLPVDQMLSELGIGDSEIKIILGINYSRLLTIGGNEDRAFAEYEKIANTLNLTELSPSAAMIIFNQLIAYGEAGGHGLTSWKERRWELDWGKVLSTPNLISLRDTYFSSWQTSGAPIRERVRQVRNLSERLTEFSNKRTREPDANWFGSTQEVASYMSPLVEKVMGEVSSMEINRNSIDDLKMLHELVGILDDRRLSAKLRSELELQIVKLMVFDEATAYLKDLIDKDGFPIKAIDWYQENLIKTPDQLQKAQDLMQEYFDSIHERGDKRITAAAGMDYVFENFFTKHSVEVFEAALESQQDDTKLRTLLSRVWSEAYMPTIHTPYRLNIPTAKNGVTEVSIQGGAQHQFVPFETFVQSFYQKLGQTETDILLRKMLISEEGVLMTQQGREKLHSLLMNQIRSNPEDTRLIELIDQIVATGLDVIDPAKLYQPIASILRERLFLAPPQKGSNQDAVEYVWREYTDKLTKSLEMYRDSVGRAETTYDRQRKAQEYQEHRQWIEDNTPTQEDMAKVLEFNPLSTREGIAGALQAIDQAKGRLTELVGIQQREIKTEQMEPVEVVLEFSKNMGAVGVRFLQLLGQYVDLPNGYQAKFDEVYDQVRGQLKYTAFQTLRREALKEDVSTELRDFWQHLHSLSPTIAGGSLMTVYVATMNDGTERIVKVLNPNAEDFVRQNIVDSRTVLERMRVGTTNPNYELAAVLLKDLEEWLVEDINTTSYERNNEVFEGLNNGFTVATSTGQQIVIGSPETTQTGTKYIKIEDLVQGKNVSEILNREGAEAARPYVEATIASYRHQAETVLPEDRKARVHSDVHIGNVRVGIIDGKLYWIDRGYYLEMPQQEVAIITPLLEGKFDQRVGMQAINYLLGLPENKGKGGLLNTPRIFADVLNTVSEARSQGQTDLATANSVLLSMKKKGIHIPIRFSLFFKNIRAQAKMAERVGINYP